MDTRKRGDLVSMKWVLVISFATALFAFSNSVKAQAQYNGEEVFVAVEVMPSLPGGDKAVQEALYKKLRYPVDALERGVEGKVFVKFIITKDGSIDNVTVARSVDPDLDAEAVRVVKLLPKFTPGKQNGNAVNVFYSVPISFQIKK